MIKFLIAPLLAAGTAAAMVWVGAEEQTYDLNVAFHCSHEVANADLPAADILVIGNSQTGASIDQAYLQQLIAPEGDVTVEKLAVVQANIVTLRMIVDEYIENRGAPKLVVYQPMVVLAEHWQQPAGHPIHPRATVAYQDWDKLVALQKDARSSPTGSWLPHWAEKGYRTIPAMWVDRQVERITATLSIPRMAEPKEACRTEAKFQLAGNWPYGTLPLKEGDNPGEVMDAAKRQEWQHDIEQRKAADVFSDSRVFEIDQNRKLLADIRAAGSEVVMVGYPSMGRTAADAQDFADFGKALGGEVIDIRSRLTPEQQGRIEEIYRDPIHLNFEGAQIITEYMAGELKGRIK